MPAAKTPAGPDLARRRALRALGRREHSAMELKQKLGAGGSGERESAQILAQLQQSGFQSDTRFAELLIRTRTSQGYGPLRVKSDLNAKGIDAQVGAAALEQACIDWTEVACQLSARRFPHPAANFAERNKRFRFLASRGFTGEQIRAALKGVDGPDEDQTGADRAEGF